MFVRCGKKVLMTSSAGNTTLMTLSMATVITVLFLVFEYDDDTQTYDMHCSLHFLLTTHLFLML